MRPLALVTSLCAAALLLGGCQTSRAPEPADAITVTAPEVPTVAPTFEPAKGVTCNRTTSLCVWRGGPSVGLTRLFFGEAAADAAASRVAKAHYPHDPIFKPTPESSCDTLVTTCYDQQGASPDITSRYFGSDAARLLEERRAQVVRYGAFVTCDQGTNICYDRFGAGVGITQLYIGEPESQALLARLRARDS